MGFRYISRTTLPELYGNKAVVDFYCRQLAEEGGEHMLDLIVQNTPVDTGNLRTSWYRIPVNKQAMGLATFYRTDVKTDVRYASFVEEGTGLWGPAHKKYPIDAKAGHYLSWIDKKSGQRVYAKRVMHPGSPGAHMAAIGAHLADAEFDRIAVPVLNAFAAEYEAAI